MKLQEEKVYEEDKKILEFMKEEKGIGVVEVILILVGNFTPYLGCVLCG